jgi:anaerobic magnesium-protoporphyrin IX monomethyl ester cyclase
MRQLDILFVHPNASKVIYQGLSKDHSAIEPPIWAAMLAQHCRINNFGAQILDCEAERLDYLRSAAKIVEIKPRIVCFVVYGQQPSASTQNMSGAVATAEEVKRLSPNTKILFVGGHVAALPHDTLKEESIDMICQNEGVYTISNLLQLTNFDDETQLKKVNGLGFKSREGTILNPPQGVVSKKNLEHDLPGMAWDLLPDIKKYRTAGWHSWSNDSEKEPFASLYTSLGCPYKCSFCMINIINRTKQGNNIASDNSNIHRWWSPEFIIKEFDKIAEMGVKNVKIADELFVLNPRHFKQVCDMLIERDYGFNMWAYSRIDTCKPEYLETLKEAGVNWLGLGIENPDQVLRKEVHKDNFKEVRIADIMDSMRAADINIAANYIFGLPMDTKESLDFTLDFAMEANTEMVNFYTAMAYPGSRLHVQAKNDGTKLPDNYSGYSQHSYDTQNLPTENLSAAEILKFRDEAWTKYHTNPNYLNLLEKKFGKKAKQNVVDTATIKLKRRLLGD